VIFGVDSSPCGIFSSLCRRFHPRALFFASFRLLGPARTRPSRSGARVDVAISSSPDVRRHSPSTEPLLRFFILRPFFRTAGSVSHLSVLGFAFVPRPAGAPSECAAVAFVPSPESSRRRFPLCFFVQRRRRPCSCLLSQPHRRACSCSAELGFVDLLFFPRSAADFPIFLPGTRTLHHRRRFLVP
jgi:hypothetical protein